MNSAAALLHNLRARGIELRAQCGQLRFRPRSAMTAELAEQAKACKSELLELLVGRPETDANLETYAHREAQRFLKVCQPWPDGRGWYDPEHAEAALAGVDESLNAPPEPTAQQPDLFDRPDGGQETFVERSARWLRECNGLPPGAHQAQ